MASETQHDKPTRPIYIGQLGNIGKPACFVQVVGWDLDAPDREQLKVRVVGLDGPIAADATIFCAIGEFVGE